MSIAVQQMELMLPAQTSARDVRELQAEVSEGGFWLEQKNPAHRRLIQRGLNRAHTFDDAWWRARIRCPLGWWLDYFGVPGYEEYRHRGVEWR